MDSSGLRVEDTLVVGREAILQFDINDESRQRFRTAIRGWLRGTYILLDRPPGCEEALSVLNSLNCSVRYLHDGFACGFQSAFTELGSDRALFRITWPAGVAGVKVRRHERIKLSSPCDIVRADGTKLKGEMRDASLGGCGVMIPVELSDREEVVLAFQLPHGAPISGVRAVVRNQTTAGTRWLVGFQYTELPEQAKLELQESIGLMLERMRDPSRNAPRVVIFDDGNRATVIRKTVSELGYEAVNASCLLDSFHLIRLAPPKALILPFGGDIGAEKVLGLIRQSRGLEQLPIVIYGGPENEMKRAATTVKSATYIPDASNEATIREAMKGIVDGQ